MSKIDVNLKRKQNFVSKSYLLSNKRKKWWRLKVVLYNEEGILFFFLYGACYRTCLGKNNSSAWGCPRVQCRSRKVSYIIGEQIGRFYLQSWSFQDWTVFQVNEIFINTTASSENIFSSSFFHNSWIISDIRYIVCFLLPILINEWGIEPGGSMPHSQGLSNNSYSEPNQPNYLHWYLFLQGPF